MQQVNYYKKQTLYMWNFLLEVEMVCMGKKKKKTIYGQKLGVGESNLVRLSPVDEGFEHECL